MRSKLNDEYTEKGLVATQPTLKWLIIIGFISSLFGLLIYLFLDPFIGSIILLLSLMLVTLCSISLLFLWLTERMLPQPK